MKGYLVKKAIKTSGKTIAEVADLIDVSREHLGRLLKDDLMVDDVYIKKIEAAGIDLNVIKSDKNHISNEERMSNIQEQVLQNLLDSNKLLQRIVTQALDAGVITIDKSKKLHIN